MILYHCNYLERYSWGKNHSLKQQSCFPCVMVVKEHTQGQEEAMTGNDIGTHLS